MSGAGVRRAWAVAMIAAFFVRPAGAMEIPQFDKMALQDQTDYINLLVDGAQKVLMEQHKDGVAAKVHKLFTEVPRGDSLSLGMNEFESNLDRARLADIRNLEKDAHATRIEVEDAMAATLEANGIDLPDSFFTVASKFKPRFPNQSR